MGKEEILKAYKSNCLGLEELAKLMEDRGKNLIKEAEIIRKCKKNFEQFIPIIENY